MSPNRLTYRFFSLTLACLVLFTSIGIAINFHSCNGTLKYIGLYTVTSSCEGDLSHNELFTENCCELECGIAATPCCTNEHFYESLDVNAITDLEIITNSNLFVAERYQTKLLESDKWFEVKLIDNYKPDLVGPGSQALHQVYLI